MSHPLELVAVAVLALVLALRVFDLVHRIATRRALAEFRDAQARHLAALDRVDHEIRHLVSAEAAATRHYVQERDTDARVPDAVTEALAFLVRIHTPPEPAAAAEVVPDDDPVLELVKPAAPRASRTRKR